MAEFEEVGVRAVVKGIGQYSADMDKVNSKAKAVGDKLKGIGQGLQKAGKGLTLGVTLPIVAIGGAAVKMAADFDTAFTEVTTLVDLPDKQIKNLREGVLDLSTTMGLDAVETTKALYQAISAGVEPNAALQFLEQNAKLAIGGVTDLATAVDLTTTVLNAFGLEESELGKVSDILFTGVKLGKTTIDELGASIFQVAPVAAASGVGIDQVTAALASLTAAGVPTSVAATQIRQGIVELGKSGTKASEAFEEVAGVGFREFMQAGGSLGEVMELLNQAADETGVAVGDLFGSVEAGQAITVLASDNTADFRAGLIEMGLSAEEADAAVKEAGSGLQTFKDNLDATADSTGATEVAFSKMEETAARDFAKLQAQFKRVLIDLGAVLLPILVDFAKAMVPVIAFVGKMVQAFGNLPGPVKTIIIAIVALVAALGPILLIVGTLVSAVGALVPIFAAVGAVMAGPVAAGFIAALLPLLPFIAAAVVIAAIVFLIIKNWGKISKFFNAKILPVLKTVVKFFTGMPKMILKAVKKLVDLLKKNWKKIVTVMLAILFPPAAGLFLIITNFKKIKEFVEKIFNKMKDALIRIAKDIVNSIIDFFKGLASDMLRIASDMVTSYINFWRDLATQTFSIVRNLMADIVGFFTALPGQIINALGSLVSDVAAIATDLMNTFVSRLLAGLPRVLDFFLGLPGAILGALGGIGGLLFDIGKGIIDSIIAGMAAAASIGGDIAKGIANALIGAANLVLSTLGSAVLLLKEALDKIPGPNPAGNLLLALVDILKAGIPSLQRGIFKVPGSGTKDIVPALLTPGEMVIPRGPAELLRAAMDNRASISAAATRAAPPASLAVSAPISITINSQSWAEVRAIVHQEVDTALDTARVDTTRAGAELSAGIG